MESEAANDAHGDPFAIVPAASLAGYRGIEQLVPSQDLELITIYLAEPQVIYVMGGALVYCPRKLARLHDMINTDLQPYDMLNAKDAAFLVDCMLFEDMTSEWATVRQSQNCAA